VKTCLTSLYETEECHGRVYILDIIQTETCAECGRIINEEVPEEIEILEEIPI
jgi:hypothetical protein